VARLSAVEVSLNAAGPECILHDNSLGSGRFEAQDYPRAAAARALQLRGRRPALDPPVERDLPHGSAPLTRFPARLEGLAKAGPSSSLGALRDAGTGRG